jgi:predicted membrane channel-forming protein YqfA (hemolysin III family)
LIRRPNDPIATELGAVRNQVNSATANNATATEASARAARVDLKDTIGWILRTVFAVTVVAAPLVFLGALTVKGNLQTAGMAVSLFLWSLFVCHIAYSMWDCFERKVVEIYLAAWDLLRNDLRRLRR